MIRRVKDLEGFEVGAVDGPIGTVTDFYFDDEAWAIRYAVVDASSWLGRDVLLSPDSMGKLDWGRDLLPVTVTKEQVENSPHIDTAKPISRRVEKMFLGYYGYPCYWRPQGPVARFSADGYRGYRRAPSADDLSADRHLRGCNALTGYHLHSNDGEIGHVEGLLVNDLSWSVRYIIVNSSNWWLGHHVLVSPECIQDVSWSQSSVTISLDRAAIGNAPAYDADTAVGRDADVSIYNHYGRNGYWHDTPGRAVAQHA